MRRWMAAGLAVIWMAAGGAGCRMLRGPGPKEGMPSQPSRSAEAEKPSAAALEKAEPRTVVKRAHIVFRNEQEVGDYLALAARKKVAGENLRATQRMLLDKVQEYKENSRLLEEQFKIKSGGRYDYNQAEKALYELSDDGKGGVAKKELFKLADPESEKKLTALLSARRQIRDEAAACQESLNRRDYELIQIQDALAMEYGAARDRDYELDSRTRTLYEKVSASTRHALQGAKAE